MEGKANEALVEFLSEVLEVPRSRIEIVAGQTGRDKLVSILDLDAQTVHERILREAGLKFPPIHQFLDLAGLKKTYEFDILISNFHSGI